MKLYHKVLCLEQTGSDPESRNDVLQGVTIRFTKKSGSSIICNKFTNENVSKTTETLFNLNVLFKKDDSKFSTTVLDSMFISYVMLDLIRNT